jgi:hypothetical protein
MVELIAIIPSLAAAYFAYRIHVSVKTPSGDTIGKVTERTHDLAAVNTAMLKDVHRATANGESSPEGTAAAERG